jgi:penicillin-binding protein 2
MVDALSRPKGKYANGKYDTIAVSGESLISSLDKDLQKFGEQFRCPRCGRCANGPCTSPDHAPAA